jgi:hypothetical protein
MTKWSDAARDRDTAFLLVTCPDRKVVVVASIAQIHLSA